MLNFIWQNRGALWTLVGLLAVLCAFVTWMAWVFGWGRFAHRQRPTPSSGQPLRYIVANLFVEIINDFRHFLALVIVVLFAVALFAAMYPGFRARNVTDLAEGVESVAAALGGLIGSIIGYYFGESAATRKDDNRSTDEVRDTSTPVQQMPGGKIDGVIAAPEPPVPPVK